MTKKQKATYLLLILSSIFCQSLFYPFFPWYNVKIGIYLIVLLLALMISLTIYFKKWRLHNYIILGIAILLLIAQWVFK